MTNIRADLVLRLYHCRACNKAWVGPLKRSLWLECPACYWTNMTCSPIHYYDYEEPIGIIMDLKTKADQRRVATGAKASSGRAHQQTPTRTDVQAPEGRKRPVTDQATIKQRRTP